MSNKKWHLGAVLIAVVILAGSVTAAFADSTPTENPGLMFQSFISKFAANLGVSEDKVTKALDTTKKQMLDEAVQQGKLTQEQADKIAANKDFGPGFGPGLGHPKRDGNFFGGKGGNLDNAANALGITVDQLKTELKDKRMQDVVTSHGLTLDEFQQKMLQLKKEEIAQAVKDGKLTQEQADKILQNMENRHNKMAPKQTEDSN